MVLVYDKRELNDEWKHKRPKLDSPIYPLFVSSLTSVRKYIKKLDYGIPKLGFNY